MNLLGMQGFENAVHHSSVLCLKVLSSSSLPKDSVVRITARGYEYSLRNAKDGNTFFGCKKRLKGSVVNDFVVPIDDPAVAEQQRGQHFVIYFDLTTEKYVIRDLAMGFGTFVRLDTPLVLKDNCLVNVGDSFLLINLESECRIKLTLFGTPSNGDVFNYEPCDATIFIGRMEKCQVHISDPLISTVQASLYCEQGNWILEDGDVSLDRRSTNATWIYLNESYEMYTGMIFKANNTLFQVNIV